MAMSFWDILEIEPTKELKVIKKAYAVKLKQLIPDEQPAEFQQLKEAFDAAVRYAKRTEPVFVVRDEETIVEKVPEIPEISEPEVEESAPSFREQVYQLLDTMSFFEDEAAWKALLTDNREWSIQEFMQNSRIIQQVLVENFMYLAKPIIERLLQSFQLLELESDALGQPMALPQFLYQREQILNAPAFSFALWPELPEEERKNYFLYRYKYYTYLNSEEHEEVRLKSLAKKMLALVTNDGDFALLQAQQILIKARGDLTEPEVFAAFNKKVEAAMKMRYGNKQLATFLLIYREVWQKGTMSDFQKKQLATKNYLVFPAWQAYLLGMLYYRLEYYPQAFAYWEQVSYYQSLTLDRYWNQASRYLSTEEKSSYQQIRAFHRRQHGQPPERQQQERQFQEIRQPEAKKKQFKWYRYLYIAAALVMFIVKVSNFSQRRPELPPTVPNISENRTYQDNYQKSMKKYFSMESLISDDADAVKRFAYYYLYTEDPGARQTLIDEYATGEAVALLQQHLNDPATYPDAMRHNFRFDFDSTVDHGYCQAIYYNSEPLMVIKEDDDGKIIDVLGPGWHEMEAAAYDALLSDIEVRPATSISFFVAEYLPSDDRPAVLAENSRYVTDEVMALLQAKQADGPDENYLEGTWQLSWYLDEPYFVVNDNLGRASLILACDQGGRIAHIYRGDWEEMNNSTAERIVAECEPEKNPFN
ncbi:hypothetical protein JZO70_03620 [Enterococcus sp. 669A]|uniref:J domain-containing protein n=1 Tax=Candidatus Enterococcus moelleringii TaxID=2815325 RepID=A0ABS3L913_9ENTE|nr:hypothetical protein [Enterococcus sp. 669A]MBO1305236.1 hypothetical protein [Enterococcus sp. 669A]